MIRPRIGRTPVTTTPPPRRRGRPHLTLPLPPPLPPLALPLRPLTIISTPEHHRVCALLLPTLILCPPVRPHLRAGPCTARPRCPLSARLLSSSMSTPTPNPAPCLSLRMRLPPSKPTARSFISNPRLFSLATICSRALPNHPAPLCPPPLLGQPVPVPETEEPG